jgi:hypothetical protein
MTLTFKANLSSPASLRVAEPLTVLLFCEIVMPSAVLPLVYSCVDVARKSLRGSQPGKAKLLVMPYKMQTIRSLDPAMDQQSFRLRSESSS